MVGGTHLQEWRPSLTGAVLSCHLFFNPCGQLQRLTKQLQPSTASKKTIQRNREGTRAYSVAMHVGHSGLCCSKFRCGRKGVCSHALRWLEKYEGEDNASRAKADDEGTVWLGQTCFATFVYETHSGLRLGYSELLQDDNEREWEAAVLRTPAEHHPELYECIVALTGEQACEWDMRVTLVVARFSLQVLFIVRKPANVDDVSHSLCWTYRCAACGEWKRTRLTSHGS